MDQGGTELARVDAASAPPPAQNENQPLLAPAPAPAAAPDPPPSWQPGQKNRLSVWTVVGVLLSVYGVSEAPARWPVLLVGLCMCIAAVFVATSKDGFLLPLAIGAVFIALLAIVFGLMSISHTTSTDKAEEFSAWCPTACNETTASNLTAQICDGIPGIDEYRLEDLVFYCMLRTMDQCGTAASAREVVMECHSRGKDAIRERHWNRDARARDAVGTAMWCLTFVTVGCLCMWILDVGPVKWTTNLLAWTRYVLGCRCCRDARHVDAPPVVAAV